MRRNVAALVLAGFLVYTGVYVFVYLFRAFRLPEPDPDTVVYVWHGDPMTRAVLVSVLFVIGLLLLVIVVVGGRIGRAEGSIRLRSDLWTWLSVRATETNETPEVIAERAIAAYRAALEDGRPIGGARGP